MRRLAPLLALVALALTACDAYMTPNKPFPAISGSYLDGSPLSSADLAGKPWVVNLWVPG